LDLLEMEMFFLGLERQKKPQRQTLMKRATIKTGRGLSQFRFRYFPGFEYKHCGQLPETVPETVDGWEQCGKALDSLCSKLWRHQYDVFFHIYNGDEDTYGLVDFWDQYCKNPKPDPAKLISILDKLMEMKELRGYFDGAYENHPPLDEAETATLKQMFKSLHSVQLEKWIEAIGHELRELLTQK
jgi:hypothetical protein